MTILKMVKLRCDVCTYHYDCLEAFSRVKEIRQEAGKDGWRCTTKSDVCPECQHPEE